jgi:murein DD-endopeptidase MepM/ murein hydrolase activator NlpD
MPTEHDHHTSKDHSFEIVVIPQGDAGSTRSFKASVMKIILAVIGIVLLISTVTVLLTAYTPVGLFLPISDEQLRLHFGAELFDVQNRLKRVSTEVLVLREYNNKLRSALGQKQLSPDSIFDAIGSMPAVHEHSEASDVADSRDEVPVNSSQPHQTVYKNVAGEQDEETFRAAFPIIVPAIGYVSRKFEAEQGHSGIDYAGKIGSLVVAAANGYVVFSGFSVDDGNMVILSHGDGYLTIYKHNQSNLKSVGEFVRRGEPIALLGNTGRTSYGPHLHFEVWKDGKPQNPSEYIIASKL